MNKNTFIVTIDLERLLQLIELSDRLVKMGYASRTEVNFVNAISDEILQTIENNNAVENNKSKQENNKVDENTIDVVP